MHDMKDNIIVPCQSLILHVINNAVSLVPRSHPQKEERVWGYWRHFLILHLKLSNHVIICICLYWSMCGHMMVHKTKKRPPMSPDPFLACMMGSGNETIMLLESETEHA